MPLGSLDAVLERESGRPGGCGVHPVDEVRPKTYGIIDKAYREKT
jgi:hypothetical protein